MGNTKAESYAEYRSDYFMSLNVMMQQQIEGIIYTAMEKSAAQDVNEVRQGLQGVADQGMTTLSIVDRLTNYLNISGGEDLREAVYSTRAFIEEIEKENSLSRGMGLDMTFSIAKSLPEALFGDEQRIIYVINGFLGNCYNRMRNGTIRIRFSAKMRSYATMLTVKITDDGAPIPPELIRIIHKYARKGDLFSVEEKASQGGDQGFGIIGYLLYQMAGHMRIRRNEKEGTNTVTIEVPQLAVRQGA